MANEATFSVNGFVATPPKGGYTKDGMRTLYMRVGWTPRRIDKRTGEWTDQPTSFVGVTCYKKVAENAATCLRRGDPIVLRGTLRVREYGEDKRVTVDVLADSIGHDLSRGVTFFKKNTEQLELTALERERAMVAVGREPLYGDRDGRQPPVQADAGQPDDAQPDPEGSYIDGPDLADDDRAEFDRGGEIGYQADLDHGGAMGYRPDPEAVSDGPDSADGEPFDDDGARRMLAQAAESAEPVTVPA
jgi:single-strand DNA-binding protein